VALGTKSVDSTKNSCLLACVTDHQTQPIDLAASLSRKFDDLVNQHNRQIVNDKPAHVFQAVSSLRTAAT
jgi:hypothetical protein